MALLLTGMANKPPKATDIIGVVEMSDGFLRCEVFMVGHVLI